MRARDKHPVARRWESWAEEFDVVESSFSGGKVDLLEEVFEGGIKPLECPTVVRGIRRGQRQRGANGAGIEARGEKRDAKSEVGDLIPMAARDPRNQAVQSETT